MKDSEVVTLDVGGKIFKTLRSTLESAGRETYFYKLFNSEMSRKLVDSNGNIFLDHNPENFSLILDYLRGYDILKGKTQIEMTSLYRDADFFGLTDLMEKIEQLPDENVFTKEYKGGMKRNLKHGYGIEITPDGFYEGDFVDGQRHGIGTLSDSVGTYKGEFKDGKKEGHGELAWNNGNKFVGFFKDNQFIKGRHDWPIGDSYFGEFLNCKMQGEGKYLWSDGRLYNGEWFDGKKNGRGKYQTNEYTYEGEYKNGKMHGNGKKVYKDGKIEEGKFENDKFIGK